MWKTQPSSSSLQSPYPDHRIETTLEDCVTSRALSPLSPDRRRDRAAWEEKATPLDWLFGNLAESELLLRLLTPWQTGCSGYDSPAGPWNLDAHDTGRQCFHPCPYSWGVSRRGTRGGTKTSRFARESEGGRSALAAGAGLARWWQTHVQTGG